MPPLVSIIVATRNRTDVLAASLKSIDAQTFRDFEIVLIDDGSSREVWEFQDKLLSTLKCPITCHRGPVAGMPGTGPAAARNRGIAAAAGRYLGFLDDDDKWISNQHLEIGVTALLAAKGDFFFSNMQTHRDGKVCWKNWFQGCSELTRGDRVATPYPAYIIDLRAFARVMQHCFVHPDQMIVSKELIDRTGMFVSRLAYGEDYNLCMRIADLSNTIIYSPQVSVSYRFPSGDSVTQSYSRLEAALQMVFSAQHVQLLCANRHLRKAALAREAWTFREIALLLFDNPPVSRRFAWRAFCTFPTAGGVVFLAQIILGIRSKLRVSHAK